MVPTIASCIDASLEISMNIPPAVADGRIIPAYAGNQALLPWCVASTSALLLSTSTGAYLQRPQLARAKGVEFGSVVLEHALRLPQARSPMVWAARAGHF